MAQPRTKVLLVPGNGCDGSLEELRECNFYGTAEQSLSDAGYEVRLSPMPDPLEARESIWLPFILNRLGADANAVLVGHSSGAAAALRIAEKCKLRGLVLIAAYDDDLGDEGERDSGYFSRPFDWNAMTRNCGFIVQFAGARDTLVPIAVQRRVAGSLGPSIDYREKPRGTHFFAEPGFPEELTACIREHLARTEAAGAI